MVPSAMRELSRARQIRAREAKKDLSGAARLGSFFDCAVHLAGLLQLRLGRIVWRTDDVTNGGTCFTNRVLALTGVAAEHFHDSSDVLTLAACELLNELLLVFADEQGCLDFLA